MSVSQPTIRPAVVAGQFYPRDPTELEHMVRRDLDRAALGLSDGPDHAPKALVVPHAGFVYSGSLAATAYVRVRPRHAEIERVVLLGPAHRVPLRSMALPSADGFATPLGVVPIDHALRAAVIDHPGIVVDDQAHAAEHSLEVHLPFLQVVLDEGWTLLPLVVGQVAAPVIADVLEVVWGGPETLIVISTDLSHYHDHDTAQRLDAMTAAAVVARQWSTLEPDQACGVFALRGLLAEADRRDLPVELVGLRTSCDTAGDPRRVVGYGAFTVG